MSELVIIAFQGDKHRAAAVLNEIRERDEAWTRGLHGAIAVHRNAENQLAVDQSFQSTQGQDAISGGLVGSLVGLALAMLTLPLTAGASAPIIGGTLLAGGIGGAIVGSHKNADEDSWWKQELGLPETFVREVQEAVGSCDSAIAIMLPAHDPGLAGRFEQYGGTLHRAQIDASQTALVRKRFAS
jgi:uncharacterized membrane protein